MRVNRVYTGSSIDLSMTDGTNIGDDPNVRRPRGDSVATQGRAHLDLSTKFPSNCRMNLEPVDVFGDAVAAQSSFGKFTSHVCVIAACKILNSDGSVIAQCEENRSLFEQMLKADAVVVTKLDELVFGEALDVETLIKNANEFWSNPEYLNFADNALKHIHVKQASRVFRVRTPIRNQEESKRTNKARLQMCQGTDELLLFLINQMSKYRSEGCSLGAPSAALLASRQPPPFRPGRARLRG